MPFIHPGIFWIGLAAVAVPVVIHLLSRRRFRVRDWAAMRFLLESLRQNRRRLRIEELILLALRCLIVLVLAAGIARFTGCVPAGILPGDDASRTVVYILDDSPSMTQTAGGTSAFALAKRDLIEALSALAQDDRAAVITTSSAAADEPVLAPSFVGDLDMESLSARLEVLPVSDVRARLAAAMTKAEAILGDTDGPKWVVLMSDFRSGDYPPGQQHQALRERFAGIRRLGAKLVVMDYARPPRDNLTVRSVELLDSFALAEVPTRVRVTVENNSPVSVSGVEVQVRLLTPAFADAELIEALLPVATIDLIEPDGRGSCELPVTFPQAGSAVVSAELPADELSADSVAHLAVDVRDAVRVLAVDGDADATDRTAGGAMFLSRALDPNNDGGYGYRVDAVSPARLGDTDLSEYHLVVLMNVPGFSPASAVAGEDDAAKMRYPQVAALERFVAEGGGLAIFTGPRINPRFYNLHLFSGGLGLLPARLGAPVGENDLPDGYVRLDADGMRWQGPLRVFAGEGEGLLRLIRFYGFTRSEPAEDSPDAAPVNVLARFSDRDRSPAILSRRFGEGTVMLFTTTADIRWTDWPVEPLGSYVAAMVDMVNALARAQSGTLTGRVGEPVVYDLPDRLRDIRATLTSPRYPEMEQVTLVPQIDKRNRRRLRYDRADAAGVYTLELAPPVGEPLRVSAARNIDSAEGALTPAGEAALASAIGSDDFDYVRRSGQQPTEHSGLDERPDYWRWAIAAVLAMLAAEMLLARRFGHYNNG